MKKLNNIVWYVADFETTSYETYCETGRARVWLWSIAGADSSIVADGDSIDSFMDWCNNHPRSLIYFHNLKFDGSFILSWLLEHEYPLVDRVTLHDKRSFSVLIGDLGQFYQIKIAFKTNHVVTIQDSLKIIPLKVKEIAKAFNLPIQKEVIDYQDYTIDDRRLEYVHHDVQIVAMAMKYFRNNGFNRMTIGSNAYHQFADYDKRIGELFPELPREWCEYWRPAYRGGRSQVNPAHAGEVLHNVKRFDINSMYPYCMGCRPMPYGVPIECDKMGTYKFELYDIDIDFDLKKGHLATILRKGGLYGNGFSYYINSDGIEHILISNIDYQLLLKHYDVNYLKINQILGFKTNEHIFDYFINKYYALKKNSTGGMRLVYKLILNNLYGKFGSRTQGRKQIPYLGDDGQLSLKLGDMEDMKIYYLPVAIAVTSWAHKLIDDAIMETGVDNFVYCDTDSVHTLGTLPSDWVDNHELGKFKLEATEDISKYIRQKCYITHEISNGNGKWTITCAGMPENVKEYLIREYGNDVINIFKPGLEVSRLSPDIKREDLKVRPVQVPGGVVLVPTTFTIK